jgi:membrane-associated PAP2 superfamily phosphatase
MPTAWSERPGLRHALLLAASAAALIALFEGTGRDIAFQHLFYNSEVRDFPLRHARLLEMVMHTGAKYASLAAALAMLALCVAGMRRRLAWLPPRHAAVAAAGLILIPLATTALKHVTNRHCPWDIVDFGGFAPYVGLFDTPPAGLTRGVCFPAGHASSGFAWLALGFALRPLHRRAGTAICIAALAAGFAMGGVRMIQGAHFISHTLWSAWLAWAIAAALSVLLPRDAAGGWQEAV